MHRQYFRKSSQKPEYLEIFRNDTKFFFILHVVDGFHIIKQTKDIVYEIFYKNSIGQLSNLLFLANSSSHRSSQLFKI